MMKKTDKMLFKVFVAISTLLNASLFAGAQTIIFSEDCGWPSVNTLIQNYDGWQNTFVLFTGDGTCDVRMSYASSGYDASSGGGNVMLNDTVKWFQISNLNTLNYNGLELYFGLRKTSSADGSDLKIYVSEDSVQWVRLLLADTLATGSGTSGWHWVHCEGVPSCQNLHIRFSNSSMTDYRLDDFILFGNEEVEDTTDTPDIPDAPDTTLVMDYNQVPFSVYPNPAENEVNIYYGNLQVRVVRLYDLYGHLLMDLSATKPARVSLGNLPTGVYILRVITDNGIFERKVVRF